MTLNLEEKIGVRFWNLGCKYLGQSHENTLLKNSKVEMQLYVLEESHYLWKTFQKGSIYMTCLVHRLPIHSRCPLTRGALKTGFSLRNPLLQYAEVTMEKFMFSPRHRLIQCRLLNKLAERWKYKPLRWDSKLNLTWLIVNILDMSRRRLRWTPTSLQAAHQLNSLKLWSGKKR